MHRFRRQLPNWKFLLGRFIFTAMLWPSLATAQVVIDPPQQAAAAADKAAPRGATALTRGARPPRNASAAAVYAPIQGTPGEADIVEIEMFVGESRVFPTPAVARIAVGNGSLLTAAALDGKEVILFANAPGTSSLFVWNDKGQYQRLKITILPGDTGRFAREVAAFLSAIPNAKASVVGANIIVEGEQLADADLLKIEELAKRYPQVVNFTNRVGWETMVALDVQVVEFPINLLTEMGMRWNPTGGMTIGGLWSPFKRGSGSGYQIDLRTGTDNVPPIGSSDPSQPVILPSGLNVLSMLNMGLNAQLNLLAQEGKATLLAQPQLTARSGSKASFIAGGEIPYAVSTRDGLTIQFKEYGIKLDITPRADPQGAVRALVAAEVSSLDRSVIIGGVPGLLTRRTQTEFNVQAGETMVLSGLLQRETSSDVEKVPLLGDLPVIGPLFRSKRYANKETELVVFVTPRIVTPQETGNAKVVGSVRQRLKDEFGPAPHLSSRQEESNAQGSPPAPPAEDRTSAPSAPGQLIRSEQGALLHVSALRTPLRQRPADDAPVLAALDRGAVVVLHSVESDSPGWRPVALGALRGWIRAQDLQPLYRPAHPVTLPSAALGLRPTALSPLPVLLPAPAAGHLKQAPTYRSAVPQLAMRVAPDANAGVVTFIEATDTLFALDNTQSSGWTAVAVQRQGGSPLRGWVPTQWLLPWTTPADASGATP